ncbi:MAG: hypothetical protein ACKOKF_04760 [Bacteroidota bacterium]
MFNEAESAEELVQVAVDELTELDRQLGTDTADADWDAYLDLFSSKTVLEPSATMIEEGKRFEGLRFISGKDFPVAVYVYFDGKSKSLSIAGSYDYENHSVQISNLENVEIRFDSLTSGGITA